MLGGGVLIARYVFCLLIDGPTCITGGGELISRSFQFKYCYMSIEFGKFNITS